MVSCKKENHSVRVRNLYASDLANVHVGSINVGSVPSGTNSSYYSIAAGDFIITGASSNCGGNLNGSGSISGTGKHRWTITVNGSGNVSIREDF